MMSDVIVISINRGGVPSSTTTSVQLQVRVRRVIDNHHRCVCVEGVLAHFS